MGGVREGAGVNCEVAWERSGYGCDGSCTLDVSQLKTAIGSWIAGRMSVSRQCSGEKATPQRN